MLTAGRTRPAATTAPVGKAGDDSALDDIRRALRMLTTATVLTHGLLLLMGVLLTLPPASEGRCHSARPPAMDGLVFAPSTRDHTTSSTSTIQDTNDRKTGVHCGSQTTIHPYPTP